MIYGAPFARVHFIRTLYLSPDTFAMQPPLLCQFDSKDTLTRTLGGECGENTTTPIDTYNVIYPPR